MVMVAAITASASVGSVITAPSNLGIEVYARTDIYRQTVVHRRMTQNCYALTYRRQYD